MLKVSNTDYLIQISIPSYNYLPEIQVHRFKRDF